MSSSSPSEVEERSQFAAVPPLLVLVASTVKMASSSLDLLFSLNEQTDGRLIFLGLFHLSERVITWQTWTLYDRALAFSFEKICRNHGDGQKYLLICVEYMGFTRYNSSFKGVSQKKWPKVTTLTYDDLNISTLLIKQIWAMLSVYKEFRSFNISCLFEECKLFALTFINLEVYIFFRPLLKKASTTFCLEYYPEEYNSHTRTLSQPDQPLFEYRTQPLTPLVSSIVHCLSPFLSSISELLRSKTFYIIFL